MRTSMFISLLLLVSVLVHEAQGRGLVKGSLSGKPHKLHENGDEDQPNLCKGKHCLESGKNRKLMMTKSNGLNNNSTPEGKSSLGGKEENFSVNPSLPVTEKPENIGPHDHDRHPDILDLAGMDYSPAKRKPPIHN